MIKMQAVTTATNLQRQRLSSNEQLLQRSINSEYQQRSFREGNVSTRPEEDRNSQANQDESDDEPLSLSESISTFGRTTMFYNQRQQLRTTLSNFFMNPFEKYTVRGRVPWKLIFHIMKLVFLTILMVLFGQNKFQLRTTLNAYQNNLGSILVMNFDASHADRDAGPVLPIAHKHYEVADNVQHSIINFFNITNSAVGIFGFNLDHQNKTVLPDLCVETFNNARVDVSKWKFTFNEQKSNNCSKIDCSNCTRSECRAKIIHRLPTNYDGFIGLQIIYQLRSIFLSVRTEPKCVLLYASHKLTNSEMSGAIQVDFVLTYDEVDCSEDSEYHPQDKLIAVRETLGQIIIDGCSLIFSIITCFLILKRLRRTFILFQETRHFYHFHYNRRLTWSESSAFLNGWDIFSIVADLLTIVGIIFKILLDSEADRHLDLTAVFLGSSVAINWILALRFLSFDKGYYILVLTLSVAMPNILRLMLCILAIYVGYVLCGWAVFGPYSYKFASIPQTIDTLFAMINGDEILDTFMQVDGVSHLLTCFSKIYFYTFVTLFIYVILSVMISLIGEAMVIAQSAARTGIGHWLIGCDVFPELGLGWGPDGPGKCDNKHKPSPAADQPSTQNLNNIQIHS